jgi:MFS family permease
MLTTLKLSFALFLGLTLIMLGNGLGGSLVGVRAQVEGFNNTVTGVIMAGYFVGFFIGSYIVPKLMAQVGHVRVFGALTAMASLAILVFPLIVDPWIWTIMRVLTGVAYAGLYIVVESWLNDKATNETRGQMLAIYLVVSSLGVAGGQLMLNLYAPGDFRLFTIVSVLISAAAIPVLISAARAPEFDTPESMGPWALYKKSPLGTVGMMLVGVMAGMLIGMGPAYAFKMSGTEFTSYFMAAIFIGGFLFTWPIGKLSDVLDRRKVIIGVAAACVVIAAAGLVFEDPTPQNPLGALLPPAVEGIAWLGRDGLLLLVALLLGGTALPLYSLCIAHTNDFLTQKQMVAASSTLIMANGFGAMLGPNIGGFAMDMTGTPGFFWALTATAVIFVAFGLYRMTRRPPAEDQGAFVAVDVQLSAVAATTWNPEVEWPETEQDMDVMDDTEAADGDATWDDLPDPEAQDADESARDTRPKP